MGLAEASLSVAGFLILLAWVLDSKGLSQLINQREKHIEELHRQLLVAKLSGVVTDRHQYVGLQTLAKMQAVPEEPESKPAAEPEVEGLQIRGTFGA